MSKQFNFNYNSAFLDSIYEETFIKLLIRDGLITSSDSGRVNKELLEFASDEMVGIKRLLPNVVMFDKIDFSDSIYDLSRLTELGIINEKGICNSNVNPGDRYEKTAVYLMRNYKNDIIKYIKEDNRRRLKYYKKVYESYDMEYTTTSKDLSYVLNFEDEVFDLKKDYDEILIHLDEVSSNMTECDDYLLKIRNNLAYSAKAAQENDSVYLSSILKRTDGKSVEEPLSVVRGFMKVSLPGCIKILPSPSSLKEALEMRKNPSLKQFRKILCDWEEAINNDEYNAASKILLDIEKANERLATVGTCRRISGNPITRLIMFATGEAIQGMTKGTDVEIIANLINTLIGIEGVIEPIVLNHIEAKNDWVHVNQIS